MNLPQSALSLLFALFAAVIISSCGSGGSDDVNFGPSGGDDNSGGETPAGGESPDPSAPSPATGSGRVWSAAEILAEPRRGGFGDNISCGGEFGFARCTCPESVPSSVRYRPAVTECNGNAAAIMYDRYLDIFSVVVRDTQNRDRWPASGSGFGGCSAALADSEDPPARCSAFKVQESFPIGNGTARVHCFGASGYSTIFADAARLTVKLADSPSSSTDPLERFCLVGGSEPLN